MDRPRAPTSTWRRSTPRSATSARRGVSASRPRPRTAWRSILARDNAVAHRGLGHVRFGEGAVAPARVGPRLCGCADRASHRRAEPLRRDVRREAQKAESGHFRVESPYSQESIAGYLIVRARVRGVPLRVRRRTGAKGVPAFTPPSACSRPTRNGTAGSTASRRANRVLASAHVSLLRDCWACAVRNYEGATDAMRRDRLAHFSHPHAQLRVLYEVIWLVALTTPSRIGTACSPRAPRTRSASLPRKGRLRQLHERAQLA